MKFFLGKQSGIALTTMMLSLIFWSIPSLSKAVVLVVDAQLKNQGDTLSLELSGQSDWSYDLKRVVEKNQTKVLLTVKGSDKQNYDKIKNIKNPFITAVHVRPELVDGKKQIEFTLSSSEVETFDYLTDYPSKLIVDFYFNESVAAPIKKTKEKKSNPQVATQKTNKLKRSPADAEFFTLKAQDGSIEGFGAVDLKGGLFNDSEERMSRFKIDLHAIKPSTASYELSEYYTQYPLLERPFGFWTTMKNNEPEYEIQPESSNENKQIRLLKKLYTKKRTLVLQKTTDWFARKYPNSKYLEMAYAMTADSLMELWQAEKKNEVFDLAQQYYNLLLTRYPRSVLGERTSLAQGMFELEKNNYLVALRKFKSHIENPQYQEKKSKHYAELGMTYCMAKLNKINEAVKMTEEIENTSSDPQTQAEAAFRRGDYLMMNEKYLDAKNQYESAAKKYSSYQAFFPNGVFNKMEAEFQLRQSMESHASAVKFIQNFPQDEFAPYALTRLGEVLDIIGAPQEKAVGAYLETQFRYGDSPKTIVARLHLMSTRMKGMKDIELKQTIDKMNELTQKSDLAHINQFKTIMLSDGYARRKEFDKSIDTLVKYYQDFPNKKNSEQVTSRIRNNIYSYIQNLSENNKNRDVLKVYKQYADNWIRKQERPDTFYYLGKAYQSAGAYEEALKQYDLAEQKLLTQRSPAAAVENNLPKIEEIYLVQAESFYEQNSLKKSENILDKIKNTEALTPAEQISRVHLASQLYERRGDYQTAIRYLSEIVRVWKDQPELVTDSAARLAQLWNKAESPQKGIDLLDQFLKQKLSAESTRKIYKTRSDIALAAHIPDAAISSLVYIINAGKSSNENLAEEKFHLGELYFQKGEIKKAENVWSSFAGNDDQFWSKLADEKMKSAQWQDEYKKYLKRIPATVGVE